ncbi:UPF0481 protein At3g47200-like [Alnus glutinosa]|uniref:UPF0481 protein At3g47200-like n=1 Tax=Alnus glutinosa TaxID=3517 RepID=UPI002D76A62C|nr:UPF0481 protein At3g47200-like [Alnus glutinosa]
MADPPVGEEIIIDIPLIDTSTKLRAPDWPECCIYRVLKLLRKVNEEAYTPKLISIGPFHNNREELRDMEIHKERYFRDFLDRTKKSQEDLRKIIEDNEKDIRLCYSEACRLNSRDFVKMILLDAIFIIELFLKLANGIYHDLLLLENQLPFFVLEKLYMFACKNYLHLSCNHREKGKSIAEHKKDLEGKKDAPFVKLFCNYFTYYDQKRKCWERFPCFIACLPWKCSGSFPSLCLFACLPCLMGFQSLTSLLGWFPMHILEVPQLVIDYGTEAIFRNLMALEQCHYPSKTYICSYVLLLNRLIDTEKDVDLLVDNKVIAHRLGSNTEVATLINKLGDQIFVAPTPSYFENIAQKLNDHYEFPLNRFLATLKKEYCTNVFRGTATIVGLIVLGFTLWSFIRSLVDE